ncbi:hypothetical protein [Jiella sp. M17.18]|uniref:hypothetical protein n=1 Tax=Jiella sp. M17.18 TaxID=3234247 RepID=UPI0034DE3E89
MDSTGKHFRLLCRSLAAVAILLALFISSVGTATADGSGSGHVGRHCATTGADHGGMAAMRHLTGHPRRHTGLAGHGTMDQSCAAHCLTAVPAADLRMGFVPLSRDIAFSITADEADGLNGPAVERPPRA